MFVIRLARYGPVVGAGSNLDENAREDALDSFILFYRREKRCLRTKIRGITFSFGTRVQEVAKMSDAVDTVSDGMAISSLT